MNISEGLVKISVRELVEFVLRSGSIMSGVTSSSRAVLGTLLHKKIQKSMGPDYEAEVKMTFSCEMEGIGFVIEGRADGIIKTLVGATIDEIKTTSTPLTHIDEAYNPLHWAQAKCYAYFYAKEAHLEEMEVQLTYYNIDTKEIKRLKKTFSFEELENFFLEVLQRYCKWIAFYLQWEKMRNASLNELPFPFASYRKGQRELAASVYRAIGKEENLYVSAPTGIGKTISTLYPALKAMGEGKGTKIFYLTAKTVTRTVAEEAIGRLYEKGGRIKSVTLTAKQKICFCTKMVCHPDHCQWAEGHYDRVDDAVYEMIHEEDCFTRAVIKAYADKYRVCPFELSLDLATWADVVICDYNYIFDPNVALGRFINNQDFVLLVDEAHNLVDRAREMYSAYVFKKKILAGKKLMGKGPIARELGRINQWLLDLKRGYIDEQGAYVSKEPPKELYQNMRRLITVCDKAIGMGEDLPNEVIDLFFEAYTFTRIFELFDEHYITYGEAAGSEVVVRLFCMDPSVAISSITSTCKSVIFFSATLLPIDYFKYMLGGKEDKAYAFPSPFEPSHTMRLITKDVSTRYRHREESYSRLVSYINEMISGKVGHYMVFFPSYKYMNDMYERIRRVGLDAKKMEDSHFKFSMASYFEEAAEDREDLPEGVFVEQEEEGLTYLTNPSKDIRIYKQQGEMEEEAREAFLAHFTPKPQTTTVNFCVLGGIFSEGIDLTFDRLIGVMVVGVGLPQLGLERELIKDYFDAHEKEGYHYAYTYPGMNKVLQAVGRLIRTEEDKGLVVLVDDRFTTSFYEQLYPAEFSPYYKIYKGQGEALIEAFWKDKQE